MEVASLGALLLVAARPDKTDNHDRAATVGAHIQISERRLTKTVLGAGVGPAAGGAGVL